MSAVPAASPRPRSRLGCAGATLGTVLVLAGLMAFIWLRSERAVRETAGRVWKAVAVATNFQPRVVVNNRVVLQQSTPALELVVVRHTMEVDREFTGTRLWSTKRLRLKGIYEAKAGYDLRDQPFTVRVDRPAMPGGRETVRVELPPARVLGVEERHVEVLELTNGMWNKIAPGELTDELNALASQARSNARGLDLPREAAESLTRQVREHLGEADRAVEIVTVPEVNPTPAP